MAIYRNPVVFSINVISGTPLPSPLDIEISNILYVTDEQIPSGPEKLGAKSQVVLKPEDSGTPRHIAATDSLSDVIAQIKGWQ
jgi:hypothetical protein